MQMTMPRPAYTTLDQIIPTAAMPYGCVFYMEIPKYGELYHVTLPDRHSPVALLSHGEELFMPVNSGTAPPRTMADIAGTEWLELYSCQYAINLFGLPQTIK